VLHFIGQALWQALWPSFYLAIGKLEIQLKLILERKTNKK